MLRIGTAGLAMTTQGALPICAKELKHWFEGFVMLAWAASSEFGKWRMG